MSEPLFIVIRVLVFGDSNGDGQSGWNPHKLSKKLRKELSDRRDEFSEDRVRRMIKKLQDRQLVDEDCRPLPELALFALNHSTDEDMCRVYEHLKRQLHPDHPVVTWLKKPVSEEWRDIKNDFRRVVR